MEISNFQAKKFLSLILPAVFLIFFTFFLVKWLTQTQYSSNMKNKKKKKNTPPSPQRLPIIGNLHQFGSLPHRSLKSLAEKYGPIMLLQVGSKPVLIISSAEAAEQVLRKHDLVFAARPQPRFVGKLAYNFKDMLFSPYGEYWRQLRTISVTQLLSKERVKSFRSLREEEIAKMVENLRVSCSSSPSGDCSICISEALKTLTNEIVSLAAIGKRCSEEKDWGQLFLDISTIGGYVNIGDYIPWLGWINYINGMEAKVSKVAKKFDEYLESIVEQGIKKQNQDQDKAEGKQNFLDVLLRLQREEDAIGFTLHRDSMKALLMDMILGATDTTYSLLEWTFTELLRNPNAMTKLQNEARQFSGMITEDDLGRMPYLKAVIKETLRIHPLGTLLVRVSREAVKIMGYDIAANTEVFVNVWMIGRDPLLWKEAEEFQPERFLNSPVDTKGRHFEYLPFGSGRRTCPGSEFALVTAELALANLIHTFNFALAGGAKPDELDMTEAPGMVTSKKIPLLLVASLAKLDSV